MAGYQSTTEAIDKYLAELSAGKTPNEYDLRSIKYSVSRFPISERQTLALKVWGFLAQRDPSEPTGELVSLLQELLLDVPLSWVLNMNIDLNPGLALQATEYHELTLLILETADQDSARRLATSHRDLFDELIKLWLLAPKTGTAEKAGNVLLILLKVDKEGCVVKRLFRDKDLYELIYTICDEKTRPEGVSRVRQSTAQTRLLGWLAEVAKTHWNLLNESYHPEVETAHGVPANSGLLEFAAVHLIKDTEDILLYSVLIQFYSDIVTVKLDRGERIEKPVGLEFLQKCGAHKRMIKLYMYTSDPSKQQDIEDLEFIYSDLAHYFIRYATAVPHRLIENKSETGQIVEKLKTGLLANRNWMNPNQFMVTDLKVLANLPRAILVENYELIKLLPVNASSIPVVSVLTNIFYGPVPDEIDPSSRDLSDKWAKEEYNLAGKLFERYLHDNPRIFSSLAQIAADVALVDEATAALVFIHQIILAPWNSGSILMSGSPPPKYHDFFKLLLEPPRSVNTTSVEANERGNMLGKMRFETAKDLLKLMEQMKGESESLVSAVDYRALQDRVVSGVWGRRGEDAQAQVATLASRT